MDAEGGLEFLLSREDIDRRRIIVYGRSLGWFSKFHASKNKCRVFSMFFISLHFSTVFIR